MSVVRCSEVKGRPMFLSKRYENQQVGPLETENPDSGVSTEAYLDIAKTKRERSTTQSQPQSGSQTCRVA